MTTPFKRNINRLPPAAKKVGVAVGVVSIILFGVLLSTKKLSLPVIALVLGCTGVGVYTAHVCFEDEPVIEGDQPRRSARAVPRAIRTQPTSERGELATLTLEHLRPLKPGADTEAAIALLQGASALSACLPGEPAKTPSFWESLVAPPTTNSHVDPISGYEFTPSPTETHDLRPSPSAPPPPAFQPETIPDPFDEDGDGEAPGATEQSLVEAGTSHSGERGLPDFDTWSQQPVFPSWSGRPFQQ